MASNLFGSGFELARVALDVATLRHEAIASNIANANSEGYTPLKVSFEEHLNKADMQRADWSPEGQVAAPVIEPDFAAGGLSPKVALDMEVVKLNMNTIQYQALTKAISRSLSVMRLAVTEGKG